MVSKFTLKAIFPLLCFVGLVSVLIFYKISPTSSGTIPVPILLLLPFTSTWLFFGELRSKMIVVRLDNDYLTVRKFGGLAAIKKISYSELEGFKTSILNSKGGENEYLYLMQGGKKIVKLSDFYHRNYPGLKQEIKTKLEDLGFEKFSYWDELKETFT